MADEYDSFVESLAYQNLNRLVEASPYIVHFENKPQQRLFEITIYMANSRFDFAISHRDAVSVTWADIVGHNYES